MTSTTGRTLLTAFAALLLAACGEPVECKPESCSGRGTCRVDDDAIVCACLEGFAGARCESCAEGLQDYDADGTCVPGCAMAALECGPRAGCTDAEGGAVCACLEGYTGEACAECAPGFQDHDSDGTCLPDCATAALTCDGEHRGCVDSGGTAVCGCVEGYRDLAGDGRCTPACGPESCSGHGDCADGTGDVVCSCDTGYAGANCSGCAEGFTPDGAGGCSGNEWTVMVYLNGDNNLDDYGHEDVAEMVSAGANERVTVIVLQDSSGRNDSRLLRIRSGRFEVLEQPGEYDMGDWHTLRDFGVSTVQRFPARHYALVMWNHGDGWRSPQPARAPLKGFSNDDSGSLNGISISNGDYGRALAAISAAAGGKLDLVGFDACLMGMYEVAKASAPYAHWLVASSELEPAGGWAYDSFLPRLISNPTLGAEALGTAIVDTYYAADPENATLALTDLDSIPALDTRLNAFADALRASSSIYGSVNTALRASQAFDEPDHRDLSDFAKRVSALTNAPATLKNAATALRSQLASTIAYNKAHSGYPGASGLAIYLPSLGGYYDTGYSGGPWSSGTWDDFLRDFLEY